jgi:hypothetical protein
MYEQFIELTNQIFWEGYAETLAKENPARFQLELSDFMNTYQYTRCHTGTAIKNRVIGKQYDECGSLTNKNY